MKNIKADETRERTYQEMIEILDRDGRCALLRPTGFGNRKDLARKI